MERGRGYLLTLVALAALLLQGAAGRRPRTGGSPGRREPVAAENLPPALPDVLRARRRPPHVRRSGSRPALRGSRSGWRMPWR